MPRLLPMSTLSRELTVFADLLTSTAAGLATGRREVLLPDGTPPAVALFWATIGWSERFDSVVVRPDDETAEAQFVALLESWRDDDARGDGSYDAVSAKLPARYRVVVMDDEYAILADETGPEDDPPLLTVHGPSTDADEPCERMASRYVATVAEILLEHVRFGTPAIGRLGMRFPAPEALGLEPVLPSILPGSLRASDVWLLANLGTSLGPVMYFDVRATTWEAVVELLVRLGDSLTEWSAHVAPLRFARSVPLPASLHRFRLEGQAPHTLYAGRLDGVPVLIDEPTSADKRIAIHADRVHLPLIDRWFGNR
jgi:hypothetical protein